MMKHTLNASIIVALLSLLALAQPATQPDRGGRSPRGARDGAPQNVEGAMKGANRAFRQLKEQINDPSKKQENLKLVGDMERNIVIAKNMPLPRDIKEDVTGDARVKLQQDYRTEMIEVVRKLLDIEQIIMTGKLDEAATKLDEIQKLRESAHEKLDVHDDEDRK